MTTPIKFSSNGPLGWAAAANIPLETEKLIEGDAMGHDHIYFNRDVPGVRAGIWRAEPYTDFYEDYPCDEFMYVLDGSVTLENDEFSETYRKGDAFLVPKGFRGYWKQTEPMLKYYVMID
ncbi:cupin domain-containing protein [Roseovarius aestuarii]|nr:cupin domain-containing protein [Roseovarius aestuarii]